MIRNGLKILFIIIMTTLGILQLIVGCFIDSDLARGGAYSFGSLFIALGILEALRMLNIGKKRDKQNY